MKADSVDGKNLSLGCSFQTLLAKYFPKPTQLKQYLDRPWREWREPQTVWLAVMHKRPFDSRMEKAEGFLPSAIVKGLFTEMGRASRGEKGTLLYSCAVWSDTLRPSWSQEPFPEHTKSILSGRAPLKPGLGSVYDDRVSVRRFIIDGLWLRDLPTLQLPGKDRRNKTYFYSWH